MQKFTYQIKHMPGIHAQVAVMLVATLKNFHSSVSLAKDHKRADGKNVFSIMSLGACKNDRIVVSIEGEDEIEALRILLNFFQEYL